MKDLNTVLNSIDISADWIGLREVCENKTFRYIRDMNPQSNTRSSSHGLMIEVLSNGQFGYYGSNSTDLKSLQYAAEKALEQAQIASKYSIHSFTKDARPKAVGPYFSSFKDNVNTINAGELNNLLVESNNALKVSDKIVSVSSYGIITETEFNYVCSDDSEVRQNFLIVNTDFSATAQKDNIFQVQ